jgi:hypothetical protein
MQCDECGREFRQARWWQHFCSPHCRDTFNNREKSRAKYEAAVEAHEDRMNGHATTNKPKANLADLLGLGKTKPTFGKRGFGTKPKEKDQQEVV